VAKLHAALDSYQEAHGVPLLLDGADYKMVLDDELKREVEHKKELKLAR
jgi:hypothetical protein